MHWRGCEGLRDLGVREKGGLGSRTVSYVLSQAIGALVLARIGLAFLPTAGFARVK